MTSGLNDVVPAEFDMHSGEYNADPVDYFKRYRDSCPIGWSEKQGGFWYVTRYQDVSDVMRDPTVFSSAGGLMIGYPPGAGKVQRLIPEEVDPPDLMAYRRYFNTELSPGAVAARADRIEHWTTHFIDQVIESGRCNFVTDLVNPVPACVTLEFLGFPAEDWPIFALPMHDFSGYSPGSERFQEAIRGMEHFQDLITAAVIERRSHPQDDFISFLVGQEINGRPLTNEEVESMVFLSIAGGTETTTSLTVSTLVYLDEHPELRERLIADPDLMKTASEEFLRYFSPVKAHARTVTQDVTVSGCPMHAGDKVHVSWASANRDPEQFPEADEFKAERFPNRHTAFGLGPHRCLGSHLARAMFTEMIGQVLRRMPDYRIIREGLQSYPSAATIGGWNSAPAEFTPSTKQG
jgi:cytochrome P450